MTRLPSIGVTKISTKDYLHNEKYTIQCSNKNLHNRLPSIMIRLPSIVVTNISITDYLFIIKRLPSIGVTKISTTDHVP